MAIKLHYFNFNGLGEAIRYILHYTKQEFEDVRYDWNQWPIKEVKDSLPFGQFPLYEEGGRRLHQSLAIARYVARKGDLIPGDPWEQAVLEAAVLTSYDFCNKIIQHDVEPDPLKKKELKEDIVNKFVDFYYSRFEKQLNDNKGFLGGKLSWADFVLVGIVESSNWSLGEEVHHNYPRIVSLVEHICSLPGVQEYISTRQY